MRIPPKQCARQRGMIQSRSSFPCPCMSFFRGLPRGQDAGAGRGPPFLVGPADTRFLGAGFQFQNMGPLVGCPPSLWSPGGKRCSVLALSHCAQARLHRAEDLLCRQQRSPKSLPLAGSRGRTAGPQDGAGHAPSASKLLHPSASCEVMLLFEQVCDSTRLGTRQPVARPHIFKMLCAAPGKATAC